MDLKTAISLIQSSKIKSNASTYWADLGCGSGLFTKALSTLLHPGSKVTAVDKDASSLKKVEVVNGIVLEKLKADFVNDDLPLKNLNGILMANALHFVEYQIIFLQKLQPYLDKTASIIIVEYDTDQANPWVPYPLSVERWEQLLRETEYLQFEEINRHPSAFGRAEIVGMWFSR